MKWIKTAIGAVIGISVLPMLINTISDLTGAEGPLADTVAGTLLDLSPIVFVAGILAFLFLKTGARD